MTIEYEYPIYPDRTYRIDVDGQKYYITGENLVDLVTEALDNTED